MSNFDLIGAIFGGISSVIAEDFLIFLNEIIAFFSLSDVKRKVVA